jgi:Na+:H+ antiporter, NhaA family
MPPTNRARLPRAVREFFETEVAGGIVLLVAAVAALVWANSPWSAAYDTLWHTELSVRLGGWGITEDLRHWVNDGLMALFFFIVGLEIKRELVAGELREWRTAALPVFAALGGMVVPALLYTAINVGGEGSPGWGIPMATDIAFAVGVLSLLGRRIAPSLTLFLLTLAVVDDIGAIVVIALFYTDQIDVGPLLIAGGLLATMVVLRLAGVRWMPLTLALGIGVWLATFESGVHATIAGVILGLLAPARPLAPAEIARDWAMDLQDEPTAADTRTLTRIARSTVSTAERLEHDLHPISSYLIIPLFALANAGVRLDEIRLGGDAPLRVFAGVVVGLVVGKLVGVTLGTWLAVRAGLARLPEGIGFRHITGTAAVAGIGFTVSLFIADLAFPEGTLAAAAKAAILLASVAAATIGVAVLRGVRTNQSSA